MSRNVGYTKINSSCIYRLCILHGFVSVIQKKGSTVLWVMSKTAWCGNTVIPEFPEVLLMPHWETSLGELKFQSRLAGDKIINIY